MNLVLKKGVKVVPHRPFSFPVSDVQGWQAVVKCVKSFGEPLAQSPRCVQYCPPFITILFKCQMKLFWGQELSLQEEDACVRKPKLYPHGNDDECHTLMSAIIKNYIDKMTPLLKNRVSYWTRRWATHNTPLCSKLFLMNVFTAITLLCNAWNILQWGFQWNTEKHPTMK